MLSPARVETMRVHLLAFQAILDRHNPNAELTSNISIQQFRLYPYEVLERPKACIGVCVFKLELRDC